MSDDLRTRALATIANRPRAFGSANLNACIDMVEELLAELDRVTAERDEAIAKAESAWPGLRSEIERLRGGNGALTRKNLEQGAEIERLRNLAAALEAEPHVR